VDVPSEVQEYYAEGRERDRLEHGHGLLEALRTQELLNRWLPGAPAVVLDVGGAAGRYAIPLAAAGYEVHLLDPALLHVQQAQDASRSSSRPLASVQQGDARRLPFPDESVDAVLLLGPLYHLTQREDRVTALREARRVLRPRGLVVAAAISRWASAVDGLVAGFLREPEFAAIVTDDLASGVHRNPTRRLGWFTTAYFHRPDELADEVSAAGLEADGPVAVEGLASVTPILDALLDDPSTRGRVLHILRATEREPALLGVSAHLLIAGRKHRFSGIS
jgi:ubiquinone/menaquinone biosynthesis C-methylase UbiE